MKNRCLFLKTAFIPIFLVCGTTSFSQSELQKLRSPNNKIYVIAHRGAHNGIPENSLAAYRKAIDLGCDFIEVDIRTTIDSQFVSIHNSSIDSYVKGKTGSVKEMTLDELKKLDFGIKTGEKWKNTRIATFEEILQICRGKIGIYLDLKDAPIDKLMLLIRKYNMEHDVVWYIPGQMLEQIKNAETLFGNSIIMPDPGEKENIAKIFETIKTPVIATDMKTLTPAFVDEAKKYGATVFTDDSNGDESEWKLMIDMGTKGIQTDNPVQLIEFLKRQKD